MDYDKLFYYRFEENIIASITEIEIGTEYIIVKSRDEWCYVAFKEKQIGITGIRKYYITDRIVTSSIDTWEAEPDTFPGWNIKEPE